MYVRRGSGSWARTSSWTGGPTGMKLRMVVGEVGGLPKEGQIPSFKDGRQGKKRSWSEIFMHCTLCYQWREVRATGSPCGKVGGGGDPRSEKEGSPRLAGGSV